jgi:hypothetical protein
MLRASTSLLFALLLSLGASTPAWAADPSSSARAAELNREAGEHAKRGEWPVAAALLTEAYRLDKNPTLLVNLAATELKANQGVNALHHLREYLGDPGADAKVKESINTQLLPRALAATGRISIRFPVGATLTVDHEPVSTDKGSSSMVVDVMPGTHAVEVTADGTTTRRSLDVAAGTSVEVQTESVVAPPPPSPEVKTTATATGQGTVPAGFSAPQADHGFWTAGHIVPLGLIVVGVAAAGVGVSFSLGANSAASKAGTCGMDTGCYSSQKNTYNSDTSVATALYIGGGVFAAAGVVTWLVWPQDRVEARVGSVTLRPALGPTQAGVIGEF